MKKHILSAIIIASTTLFVGCSDNNMELLVPYPTNVTLNELKLDTRFSHKIVDTGFSSKGIHFNTVKGANGQLEAGFCYSNRSQRSFTWKGDETSLDSLRYSVWTTKPNDTETYAVCRVKGEDAYFTLETPSEIEYILVANTTWSFLAMTYGDQFGTKEKPEINLNIPSKPKGIWYTFVNVGVKKFTLANKDYFRLTAKGYLNGKTTGNVTFDLACCGSNSANATWNYIIANWMRMNLNTLGVVDKVVFSLDSSDKDTNGNTKTPAWFCLDGIQLKR